MSEKKQKQYRKGKEQRKHKKAKVKEFVIEIAQTRSDIKTFIEKFKSDVEGKKKAYQIHARKSQKKKS